MKAKVKVKKDSRIMFDGEFITNGHWAARKESVLLSDKQLQTLVDNNIRFDRDLFSEIKTGEDVTRKFSINTVMETPSDAVEVDLTKHGYKVDPITWAVRYGDGENAAWMNEVYSNMLQDMCPSKMLYSRDMHRFHALDGEGNCMAVVMELDIKQTV